MSISPQQAITAATQYTGFEGSPTVSMARATASPPPFSSNTGAVVEVVFEGVRLELPSAVSGQSDEYSRRVVVRLTEANGQFLGATLRAPGDFPRDVRPIPGGALAEQQLRDSGEQYTGLPSAPPRHTLLQALDQVLRGGVGSPLVAREIEALYVDHTMEGRPAMAAWVLTLNGIPPLPHHGPPGASVPTWQRNHIRNVVNAETGQPQFATTIPQPQPRPFVS